MPYMEIHSHSALTDKVGKEVNKLYTQTPHVTIYTHTDRTEYSVCGYKAKATTLCVCVWGRLWTTPTYRLVVESSH